MPMKQVKDVVYIGVVDMGLTNQNMGLGYFIPLRYMCSYESTLVFVQAFIGVSHIEGM